MVVRSVAQTSLAAIEWLSIVATALALVNSMVLLGQHAVANKHPLLQKYTLRILLMVPVYSLVSCISLWLHGNREVLHLCEIARMLMESLAIFSFLQYILVAAGGAKVLAAKFDGPVAESSVSKDMAVGEDLERGAGSTHRGETVAATGQSPTTPMRTVKHFPLLACFLPQWRSARRMIRWCVRGTLTYVVVGGGMALVKLTLLLARVAQHGEHLPGGRTLDTVVEYLIMVSQCVALSSLATLAVNMLQDLEHIRPRAKFLSVKMVVFFTFWQGLLLQFLARQGCLAGLVDLEHDWWDSETVAFGFQNLLTCLEMCVVSIIHFWIWQPHDYLTILAHLHIQPGTLKLVPEEIRQPRPTPMPRTPKWEAAGNVANFKDILATLQDVRNSEFKRHRNDSRGAVSKTESEPNSHVPSEESSPPRPNAATTSTTATPDGGAATPEPAAAPSEAAATATVLSI